MNTTRHKLISILKKTSIGKSLFYSGTDQRTINTRDNVLYSSAFRGVGMVVGLLMVPLMLQYLNPEKYGIWLTLTSVVAWFNFFDVGLGNGLRNKLAEALAQKEENLARGFVSTTYALLTIIVVSLAIVFIAANQFIDWAKIFNVSDALSEDLRQLVLSVFIFFCLRFVLGLLMIVLNADQKIGKSSFIDLVIAISTLGAVYLVRAFLPGSLFWLGTAVSAAPVAVLSIASLVYYTTKYKVVSPSFKYIRFPLTRDLLKPSVQFFVLQAIVLLIFFSNNLIIAQLMDDHTRVAEFSTVFKYFSVVTTISVLIINPFWSAATDAYFSDDFGWLRSASKRLVKVWMVISLGAIAMALVSPFVYRLWIGEKLHIDFSTTALMCAFVILLSWHNSFVYLINGIGKIRLQLYIYIVMGILIIPLSIFFIRTMSFGINGSILAMIVCLIPPSILIPIQFHRIIDRTATGIFNK